MLSVKYGPEEPPVMHLIVMTVRCIAGEVVGSNPALVTGVAGDLLVRRLTFGRR